MPKLKAKYVPIGTKIEESERVNNTKSLRALEQEAAERNKRIGMLGANKADYSVTQLAKEQLQDNQSVANRLDPEAVSNELKEDNQQQDEVVFDNQLIEAFLSDLSRVEAEVETGIESGEIKLVITNADQNMQNLTAVFDDLITDLVDTESIDYQVRDEKKISYSQVLRQATTKLQRLEQTIDHQTYQNELKLCEIEDSMLRQNRYRKKKLEGLEEIGGVSEKNHNTSEQQQQIAVKSNTDFGHQSTEYVERRAFSQDYEGSDLEHAGSSRDKLEAEILNKKNIKNKPAKKQKQSEEEKIAAAKERLRLKQEKRIAKQQKRTKVEEITEIDLVGNKFDIEQIREEKMDRLLEIKKLSAKKKELQKQKEKQRSKATKEFYKYKKVNKKSHIVGFKQ